MLTQADLQWETLQTVQGYLHTLTPKLSEFRFFSYLQMSILKKD